ncbi:MAG: hypothetical protein WCG47_24890, partial [Dermatophilaceae bacterium]
MQPPPVQVIEGQLLTARLGLATHDQPQPPPQQRRGGLGDLAACVGLATHGRGPCRGRIGGQGMHRVKHVDVTAGGDGEVGVVALGRGDDLLLVAGRVHPNRQPVPVPGPGRDRPDALVDERAHRPTVARRPAAGPDRRHIT